MSPQPRHIGRVMSPRGAAALASWLDSRLAHLCERRLWR